MRINEIFYSLQGEGCNTGRPAVFVRFSGCNIKCPFCDTEHQEGKEMTEAEIADEVAKYPTSLVILTGGEPTLFINDTLLDMLHEKGKIVAIETNGTNKINPKVNYVTISPKFEFVKKAEIKADRCDELKVVYNGENDMSLYDSIRSAYYYLQPCDTGDAEKNQQIIIDAIRYIKENPKWRLSLQTQKILAIR